MRTDHGADSPILRKAEDGEHNPPPVFNFKNRGTLDEFLDGYPQVAI